MAGGDWKEMFVAVEDGNIDLVKYHIRQGVNLNYQHPEILTTPLIESIEQGHIEITKYLLENGADPHIKAGFSTDTPMIVARRVKNQEAIALLKPYYKSFFQKIWAKIHA